MGYRRRYRRRNFGRRRRRTSRLRYIKRKTGARSQARQIASLERRVSQLAKESSQYAQWTMAPEGGGGATGIDLVNGQFYVNALVRPNGWIPLFQTAGLTGASTAIAVNKMKITSFDLQFVFSPKNSLTALTPRIVRVYLMKLKKETAQDTLQATTGMSTAGLNAAAAADNQLIYKTTTDGGLDTMVKFNPAAFDIKAYREFTVANIIQETAVPDEDDTVTNTSDALQRCRMFHTAGNELKAPKGTVRELNELEIMPLDRWYVVVHVGGWGNDGDNQIRMDTNWFVNSRMYI